MDTFFFSRRGVSVVTVVAMLASQFGPLGLNLAFASGSAFNALLTTANVSVGANTQTSTDATPTPNVAALQATGATTGTDGSTVTAVTFGTSKNGLTIAITDDDATDCASVTLGGVTPTYTVTCDLDISSSGAFTPLTATALTSLIDGAADLTAVIKGTGGNTVVADTITLAGGVDSVAQISTITPANVEVGDVFTTTINGTVITFTGTLATVANITAGLTAAINLSAQSASVTASDLGTAVQVTANVPGTPFIIVSGSTNRSAVAQVVTFTPVAPTIGETLSGSINGTSYNYTITGAMTVAQAVTAFRPIIDADPAVTCVDSVTTVTCTADVAGTAFTYAANIVDITSPTISEVTPVPTLTNTATPSLTISSSEIANPTFSGACTSAYGQFGAGNNTITLDSLSDGTYSNCSLILTDLSNNASTSLPFSTFTIDTTPPTITIGATPTSVNSGATSAITFTLSEPSVNFTSGDVTVVGGTLSAFAGSGTGYTATFTPTPSSTTTGTIDVAGGVFTDAFGNANVVASQNLISVDTIVPTVVLSVSGPNPTNTGFTVTATFSEPVTGVTLGDFVVGNGTASAFNAVSSTIYTAHITPTGDGAVTVDMAATAAQDSFLNNSTLATQVFRVYDATAPVITLTGSGNLTVAHGSTYVDAGATWADALDGTGTLVLPNSGSVNTLILGVYTLQYWKVDAAGNTGTTVTRTVIVTDQTVPVVTLSGSATITLAYNSLYTDAGASWTDNIDGTGNILSGTYGNTGTFQSSGSVNTGLPGTYTITYKKVDAAGNVGSATRTIVVNQNISNGGSAGVGGSYTPIVSPTSTGTQSVAITPPKITVNIPLSSNPNITQDTFVKKISDMRRSHTTIITQTTLEKGTLVYVFKLLPNGKEVQVGTTRVLSNGKIRFSVKTTGKFHIVQK